jgi:hypothetical protein
MCSAAIAPRGALAAPAVDVSVIVPTYCEAENLVVLIPKIDAALASAKLRGEILVVDDAVPTKLGRCVQIWLPNIRFGWLCARTNAGSPAP